MVNRVLPVVLASLALLGPLAIHLFFPLIPVLKSAFEFTNAQAQLAFSAGILSTAFSTLAYGSLADPLRSSSRAAGRLGAVSVWKRRIGFCRVVWRPAHGAHRSIGGRGMWNYIGARNR